jgi:hypothetical protein
MEYSRAGLHVLLPAHHPTRQSGLVKGPGHAAEEFVGEAGYARPAEEGRKVSRGLLRWLW